MLDKKKIGRVGRDCFFFFFFFYIFFYVELYHNYQIYLDFAQTSQKIFTKSVWLSLDVSKSTDRMANSVDPDQTAPVGAV